MAVVILGFASGMLHMLRLHPCELGSENGNITKFLPLSYRISSVVAISLTFPFVCMLPTNNN